VLPRGHHSWNILLTKEARVDPKVVQESTVDAHISVSFVAYEKSMETNKHTCT